MSKEMKTQAPQPGIGPRRGNRFAETEYAKDIGWTLKRIASYFVKEKKLVFGMLAAVLGGTLAGIYAPMLQSNAVDIIAGQRNGDLKTTLVFMLATYLAVSLMRLAQGVCSANLSLRIVKQFREELFGKVIDLPVKYTDTHSHGDVMSRMTNDVENVSNTISQSLGSLVSGVLTLVGTVTIMFLYCWQLTLITMVSVILTVLVTKKMSGVMRKVYRKRSALLGELNGHSEEMITGYRSIVAYNKQDDVTEEFEKTSDELAKVSVKAEFLGGSMGPIMNCISNIGFVIVAAFGGYFAFKGLITIGTISAFIIYAKQFSRPINEIAQLYGNIQTAVAGAERVFALMDHPDEDNSGDLPLRDTRGEISFRHVNFSYIPGKQVLHDFNLDVKPGQKIALVGATGSGKTTVVNLLMRFYPLDSGEILIDGVNINDIRRDELRRSTAIVLQDTFLFSDTIGGNIKYADRDASDERMKNAAKMSNISRYIERQPDGYDTYLSHAGESLSHGQRQLLAIARAVLADPKVLILDEATSSVDTRTEKNIQNAMVNLMKNRTSVIIAHRLSTVQDADLIVVMDHGRVVETGSHEELLAQNGVYHALYQTQFEGKAT